MLRDLPVGVLLLLGEQGSCRHGSQSPQMKKAELAEGFFDGELLTCVIAEVPLLAYPSRA